jgi:hypothetical protein
MKDFVWIFIETLLLTSQLIYRTIRSYADEAVAFAGHIRKKDESWHEALATWLGGRILCQEAKKYVGNFMAVHRFRPWR